MKKVLLLFPALLLFGGCFWEILEWGCEFSEEEEGHCYQSVAVQKSNPEGCEKVTSDFTTSNPPKDKCYLMIAENTGDPSVCNEIVGGSGSYTREECIHNVLDRNWSNACEDAEDEMTCRTIYALNGGECGRGFILKNDQCEIQTEEKEEVKKGLSNAEKEDIESIADALGGKYMEFLENDIATETDPAKVAGLTAYQDFLQKSGGTMQKAQTTFEKLTEVKRIFLDTYTDEMAIQNTDISPELDPGLFDQIEERLFGAPKPLIGIAKENADAEQSLQIYEALLLKQEENEFLQKDTLNRIGTEISSRFRNEVTGELVEGAEDLAKSIAGTAFGAVTQVGDALKAFQDEAKKQTFLGLARAYNRRRAALEEGRSSLSPREIHKEVVRQVKEDPYRDNTNTGVIKHGNLLKNDCGSYKGELCVSFEVWWVAMDKTYEYQKKH